MNPEEALGIVIDKLNDNEISYMIVGSFASNLHGVPRTTHDADIVLEVDEKSLQAFASANFLNRRCWFGTAEDTILSKLEWSKKAESERQFRDAVNIAKVQSALNWEYLKNSSEELGIEQLLEKLQNEI